jgi:hypothetical protein
VRQSQQALKYTRVDVINATTLRKRKQPGVILITSWSMPTSNPQRTEFKPTETGDTQLEYETHEEMSHRAHRIDMQKIKPTARDVKKPT